MKTNYFFQMKTRILFLLLLDFSLVIAKAATHSDGGGNVGWFVNTAPPEFRYSTAWINELNDRIASNVALTVGQKADGRAAVDAINAFTNSTLVPSAPGFSRTRSVGSATATVLVVREVDYFNSPPPDAIVGQYYVVNFTIDIAAGPGGTNPGPVVPPVPNNPPLIEWVGNLPDTVDFGYDLPLEVKAKAPGLNMQQITLEARYLENVNGTLVAQVVQIAANPYVGGSDKWQAIGNPFGLTVRDDDVDVTFVGEARTSAGLTAMVTGSVKFLGRKSDKPASGTLNVDAPTVACTFDWETAKFTAVPSNLAEPVTFAWQVDNLDIGGGSTQSAKLAGGAHRVAVKMTGSDGTVVNAAQDFTMPTPLPPFPRVILTADRSMWRATGKVRIHWEIVPVPGPSTWRPQSQ
jgi:hypothetical protein